MRTLAALHQLNWICDTFSEEPTTRERLITEQVAAYIGDSAHTAEKLEKRRAKLLEHVSGTGNAVLIDEVSKALAQPLGLPSVSDGMSAAPPTPSAVREAIAASRVVLWRHHQCGQIVARQVALHLPLLSQADTNLAVAANYRTLEAKHKSVFGVGLLKDNLMSAVGLLGSVMWNMSKVNAGEEARSNGDPLQPVNEWIPH